MAEGLGSDSADSAVSRDYRRWTDLDLYRLRQNYGRVPARVLAERMGRTIDSVHRKAHRLGLRSEWSGQSHPHEQDGQLGCTHQHRRGQRCWSAAEVFELEVSYGRISTRRLAARLGRSVYAVTCKASRLGLTGDERLAG